MQVESDSGEEEEDEGEQQGDEEEEDEVEEEDEEEEEEDSGATDTDNSSPTPTTSSNTRSFKQKGRRLRPAPERGRYRKDRQDMYAAQRESHKFFTDRHEADQVAAKSRQEADAVAAKMQLDFFQAQFAQMAKTTAAAQQEAVEAHKTKADSMEKMLTTFISGMGGGMGGMNRYGNHGRRLEEPHSRRSIGYAQDQDEDEDSPPRRRRNRAPSAHISRSRSLSTDKPAQEATLPSKRRRK
jgi:hypothetical protein